MNKLQIAEQFRKAVILFAQSLPEEKAAEISCIYDDWKPGTVYEAGQYIAHGLNSVGDKQLYKVIQTHTSQAHYPPDTTNTLYTPIGLDNNGHVEWSRPTGAHDAYNKGDVVNYNGTLYKSLIDGNIHAPDEQPTLWEVIEE